MRNDKVQKLQVYLLLLSLDAWALLAFFVLSSSSSPFSVCLLAHGQTTYPCSFAPAALFWPVDVGTERRVRKRLDEAAVATAAIAAIARGTSVGANVSETKPLCQLNDGVRRTGSTGPILRLLKQPTWSVAASHTATTNLIMGSRGVVAFCLSFPTSSSKGLHGAKKGRRELEESSATEIVISRYSIRHVGGEKRQDK